MKAASIPIAMFLVCAGGAEAFAFCSEPQAPSCATRYGAFDDENDFEGCKRKMRFYSDEVDTFTRCQSDAIQEARNVIEKASRDSQDAVTNFNDTVQRFNRRARGG